jgi:hypothetical protein
MSVGIYSHGRSEDMVVEGTWPYIQSLYILSINLHHMHKKQILKI